MAAIVDHELFGRIEADLLRLSLVDRSPAVRKGMRAAVAIPAKRTREKLAALLPYEGDKKGKPPLKDAVGVKVYQEDATGRMVGRVTWVKAKGGHHGHLVEKGHRIVVGGSLKAPKTTRRNSKRPRNPRAGKGRVTGGVVAGRYYLADSWQETEQAQMKALEAGVVKAIAGKN